MVMDMDQARHQYNTEKEDWALTVEGLIREERMSADRETVKMDKILGAISYADSYLRTMQEAVNGLRLAKHYTELDNQAVSDELGKENQQLVQLTAESEQYQTQKSMLLILEAIAVKALQQIISDISTSDEHRVVLERERIVCERILIRERKMSGQRQLELDLMAEEEWRRFRDLMSRSSSASPSMVDIAMTTDPVRTRGTREALTVRDLSPYYL
uniref:Uncharacterized protein n=1 Tax=Spongospora subterranea TaxID=70186 RepID=A0A0H5R2R2_9EUKA|eukprot:CRZ02184.1 hypothetical protein [Spongospora subterranea]